MIHIVFLFIALLWFITAVKWNGLFYVLRQKYPSEVARHTQWTFSRSAHPSKGIYVLSGRCRVFLEGKKDVILLNERKKLIAMIVMSLVVPSMIIVGIVCFVVLFTDGFNK